MFAILNALQNMTENGLGGLWPTHSKDWWPLLEDIFRSPEVATLRWQLWSELLRHEELVLVGIDATMRCCMPLFGQAKLRSTWEEKKAAAIPEGETLRRAAQLGFMYFGT